MRFYARIMETTVRVVHHQYVFQNSFFFFFFDLVFFFLLYFEIIVMCDDFSQICRLLTLTGRCAFGLFHLKYKRITTENPIAVTLMKPV